MDRKQKRAINYLQTIVNEKPKSKIVRIGKRDPVTGNYEVILPSGEILKNGIKLFSGSLSKGSEVQGSLSPNGQFFYLDFLEGYEPILIDEVQVEPEIDDDDVVRLFLCIDTTRSLETEGIKKALEFLIREEEGEEVGYLVDNPNAEIGFISFGDNVCQVFFPTTAQDVIDELNNQIDLYNGEYNTEFWGSEGTDLPENGIDAIAEIVEELTDIYLVTDNENYSRNTANPEDILERIEELQKTVFIDFIEPKNVTTEHIVESGSEENPYCSDSANLAVKVNEETVGIYGAGSEVLIIDTQGKYRFKSIIALFTGLQIKKYIIKGTTSANVFRYYARFYVVDSPDSEVFNSFSGSNTITFISNVHSAVFFGTGALSYNENVLPSDASLSSIRTFFENTSRLENRADRVTRSMISSWGDQSTDIIEILINEPVYPIEITQLYNFRDSDFTIARSSTYNSFTASFNDEIIFRHLMQTLNFDLNRSKNDFDDELLTYDIDGNTLNVLYDGSLEISVAFSDWNLVVKEAKALSEFPQFIKWNNGQHETQGEMFSYGYSVDLNNTELTLNLTQQIGSNPPQNFVVEWGTINYPVSFLYIAYTFDYDENFPTEIIENTDNYFKVFSSEENITQIGFLMFYPDDNDGYNIEYQPLRLLELDTFNNEEMILTINSITINKTLDVTIIDPNNINDANQFEVHIYPSVKSGEITEFVPVVDTRNIMTPLAFEDLDGLYGKFAYKVINPNGIELVSNVRQLKVNGNNIQSLEEEDEVKVICQPQEIPLILPDKTLYTDSLPPSEKIIYL